MGLELQKANCAAGGKHLRYEEMANLLPGWKEELEWLSESPSQALQQALIDLSKAYKNFFAKRADSPSWKKKGVRDSFRFPQGFELDQANDRIFLPKLGWVRYRNSRKVVGKVKNVTVSLRNGRWYISIQTEREVRQPIHPSVTDTGVDLGVVRFATHSDGKVDEPRNAFKQYANELRKAQQDMSQKKKFSNNWKKAKKKVQKIHQKIANARRDYLHKASTTLSKSHAIVFMEKLKVLNMSRSASGTVEEPGKNVKAKSGLNRSLLDQGWGEYRRQVEYKLKWRGGWVVGVSPINTSRTCPECKYVSKDNRKSQAVFFCMECGYTENADLVAAMNIRRAGWARIACQVNGELMPSATGTTLGSRAGSTQDKAA